MGLVQNIKRRLTALERADDVPLEGSGGAVVTRTHTGAVVHDARPLPVRHGRATGVIADNDGTNLSPTNDDDFTDERYFVQINAIMRSAPALGDAPEDEPIELAPDPCNFDPFVVVASNLAERDVFTDPGSGSHLLPAGTQIILWQQEDEDGYLRWVFCQGVVPFEARITGNTQDGSNKRWVYDFVEVEKSGAGYGGWSTLTGGRSGEAYNRFENMNGASGLFGNGVDSSNLTGTFDIQPIPTGVVVEMKKIAVQGEEPEYWFSAMNGIDGECS